MAVFYLNARKTSVNAKLVKNVRRQKMDALSAKKSNLNVVPTKNYSKTLIGTFKCANALMTISEMTLASVK